MVDILIHIFMVGSLNIRFMKWVEKTYKSDIEKFEKLFCNSKYRYNQYLRGTTLGRYKNIRKIISLYEDISTKELALQLLKYSEKTEKFKNYNRAEDWLSSTISLDETENECNFTLAYCYRRYVQGFNMQDIDVDMHEDESISSYEERVVNHFIVTNLRELAKEFQNVSQKYEIRPESKKIMKRIEQIPLEHRSIYLTGYYPKRMALKSASLYNIPASDFESATLSKQELYKIINEIVELVEDQCNELIKEEPKLSETEIKDRTEAFIFQRLNEGVATAKLAKLYNSAKNVGMNYMDIQDEYREMLNKYKKEIKRLPELEQLCKKKQESLNTMQIKYEKLERENIKLKKELGYIK